MLSAGMMMISTASVSSNSTRSSPERPAPAGDSRHSRLPRPNKANAALGGLIPAMMARLLTGEAYAWSTDESFNNGAAKMKLRPRVTKHGETVGEE